MVVVGIISDLRAMVNQTTFASLICVAVLLLPARASSQLSDAERIQALGVKVGELRIENTKLIGQIGKLQNSVSKLSTSVALAKGFDAGSNGFQVSKQRTKAAVLVGDAKGGGVIPPGRTGVAAGGVFLGTFYVGTPTSLTLPLNAKKVTDVVFTYEPYTATQLIASDTRWVMQVAFDTTIVGFRPLFDQLDDSLILLAPTEKSAQRRWRPTLPATAPDEFPIPIRIRIGRQSGGANSPIVWEGEPGKWRTARELSGKHISRWERLDDRVKQIGGIVGLLLTIVGACYGGMRWLRGYAAKLRELHRLRADEQQRKEIIGVDEMNLGGQSNI